MLENRATARPTAHSVDRHVDPERSGESRPSRRVTTDKPEICEENRASCRATDNGDGDPLGRVPPARHGECLQLHGESSCMA
jgi:hypothetical protein